MNWRVLILYLFTGLILFSFVVVFVEFTELHDSVFVSSGNSQSSLRDFESSNDGSASDIVLESNKKLDEEVLCGFVDDTGSCVDGNFSLMFVGDMMFGRYVEELIDKYGDDYPFERIDGLFDDIDFVVGNFEGPISENHSPTVFGSTSFSFRESSAKLVADTGFDLVTLGNNHTLDMGVDSFLYTREVLADNCVLSAGHAVNAGVEYSVPVNIRGADLRFYSFNETFSFIDPDDAVATVREAASDDVFDVVSVHWGVEYQTSSSLAQRELAHALVDAGADLIIGHHPHVVQESEEYDGVMIYYSLGNFVFDQYFSDEVQEGLVVLVEMRDGEPFYTSIPVESVLSQPALLL